MKPLFKAVTIVLTICYPFLIYWGLQHYPAASLLPFLLIMLVVRWFSANRNEERIVLVAVVAIVIIISVTWNYSLGLKFYPALVNLGLLILFGGSLLTSTSLVERLARLHDQQISPRVVAYTRRVTQAWTIFFVFNGCIAMITALWASDEVWLLYNGFIAYLLIGALAGGEWLLRQRAMQ